MSKAVWSVLLDTFCIAKEAMLFMADKEDLPDYGGDVQADLTTRWTCILSHAVTWVLIKCHFYELNKQNKKTTYF